MFRRAPPRPAAVIRFEAVHQAQLLGIKLNSDVREIGISDFVRVMHHALALRKPSDV